MNIWQYILRSTPASLGPVAIAMIFASVFGIILGIALMVLPKELTHLFASRTRSQREEPGLEERRLRAELRAKTGVTIITFCSALILAFVLRLLGTPGLDTRLLPALVLLTVPFLVCYITLYRLLFYPRYLKGSRRIDTNRSYSVTKKSKKIAEQKPGHDWSCIWSFYLLHCDDCSECATRRSTSKP